MVAKPCACNRVSAALSMLGSSSTTATIVRLFSMKCLSFRLTGKPSQAQIFEVRAFMTESSLGGKRVEMSLLKGIDRMRDMLLEKRNVCARASGQQRVVVGARGMGKSSLVKALHATVNATHARSKGGDGQLKLIEIHRQDIESLPDLMVLMRGAPYRFIVHLDTALVGPRKAFAKCNRRNLNSLCLNTRSLSRLGMPIERRVRGCLFRFFLRSLGTFASSAVRDQQ